MTRAVVLLSGGMDSTVATTLAVRSLGAKNVSALSINYHQRHAIELRAAADVAEYFGISDHFIPVIPNVFEGAGSTLIDPGLEQPHMSYKELEEAQGVSPTYVPYRNGTLLSIAAAFALVREANFIYIATHAEDARNWAYPDCTPEFNGAMANAIYVGTYHKVRLITPLQWIMKPEIVRIGLDLGSPFHLTHSCYEGKARACGLCPTCVERIEAFRKNGVIDPIPYAIAVDWGGATKYLGS